MSPALLTIPEAAERLRGRRDRATREFVRGLILDGRLAAIKQRGRWYIQARSIDNIATPTTTPPVAKPPRRVTPRGARTA